MRLQRIEMSGFKSFSDRAELAFDTGVTAIVGPNGCGKSNVVDAITWVLGEQSAKSLRGDRMEDVIFSGSDARKPTASAEVKLLLSDVLAPGVFASEPAGAQLKEGNGNGTAHGRATPEGGNGNGADPLADEAIGRAVEVTRRLYRSGESEYLIDGQICRLRDIHDLLMDTGLGAKAYAIIEQGKIGMILSSRPTDRRQLIEEAAGITKYKARRRAAELKLDASQVNLTRVDDIVFELEKQRSSLKRQAAKARRHQRLRDELRRWEKVLLARRYRELVQTIESTRERLAGARADEAAAAARLAALEANLGRIRLEVAEAEARSATTREEAHARELEINRLQQQVEFTEQKIASLDARARDLEAELEVLGARRDPGRRALDERRRAAAAAEEARAGAESALAAAEARHAEAYRGLEGFDADVEAARAEVYSAMNAATALQHALEHASAADARVGDMLAKLDVEELDLRLERERVEADRADIAAALKNAQEALERTHGARAARESELASARIELEWRLQSLRAGERELAALSARLTSLEELDAARAAYTEAARLLLARANGTFGALGAVADFVETDRRYERAVEACLGDLLQCVVVETPENAVAGLALVKKEAAGRCGFVITRQRPRPVAGAEAPATGLVALSSVLRFTGSHAAALVRAAGDGWIAETLEQAMQAAHLTSAPIATLAGDVLRGPQVLYGGAGGEARGILQTKGEIKELRTRVGDARRALDALGAEIAVFEQTIAHATTALSALQADQHRQEKAIVGLELQIGRAAEDLDRLGRRAEQLALERRQAEEERRALDARSAEARASMARIQSGQREADERLGAAQRRLIEAREALEHLGRVVAEGKAQHAALVERAGALAAEVSRLEEGAQELDSRVAACDGELAQATEERAALAAGIEHDEQQLDTTISNLDRLRQEVRAADDALATRRGEADVRERDIRDARRALDEVRSAASEIEVTRATAESSLSHLAASCQEAAQTTLDDVLAEVEALERDGIYVPDTRALGVDEPDDDDDSAAQSATQSATEDVAQGFSPARDVSERPPASLTAEEAIAELRAKIDRLGAVNMMAIEQFDELESRYAFLTTERQDLLESIAATIDAIRKIDQTSKERFQRAFEAINRHFQDTFSTLFGGGRASLMLLDENDLLESGIDIIAQPPGKRLQNVQLLSGGEKALTAISLMFAMFKHKPSPFCLLDEIDAPLDDANIGRFVEMLRSMLGHTQFILITHNRKTMEIADRLYGVTMEEPGVSKLISVRLN